MVFSSDREQNLAGQIESQIIRLQNEKNTEVKKIMAEVKGDYDSPLYKAKMEQINSLYDSRINELRDELTVVTRQVVI